MANSRTPNLFDPLEQYLGPVPEVTDQFGLLNDLFRPQRLSKEDREELQEQQRLQAIHNHAGQVAAMLLQDQTYMSGSPKRQELMLEDWEKNRWKPYAAAVFGKDTATASAVKRAIMDQVKAPLKAQREAAKASPGVLSETWAGVRTGVDRIADLPVGLVSAVRDLRVNNAREELAELRTALAEGKPVFDQTNGRYRWPEQMPARIAELENSIIPARMEEARIAEARRKRWTDESRALADERYAPFVNRQQEELRRQELAAMGSDYPLLASAWESPGVALRRAPGFAAEQLSNIVAIGGSALAGGLVGGPPGAAVGAGVSGAALGAGYEGQELAQRLDAATPQELAQMPVYNALIAQGHTPADALLIMRQQGTPTAVGLGALEGGLLSALGPEAWVGSSLSRVGSAAIPRALGSLVPGAVARRGATALAGASIEGFQEGLEDVIVNAAMNQATGRSDPLLRPQTLENAVLGAASGAGLGFISTTRQRRAGAPAGVEARTAPNWNAYYDGLLQEGFTPTQAQYMASQMAAQVRAGQPVTQADAQRFYAETLPGVQQTLPIPGLQTQLPFPGLAAAEDLGGPDTSVVPGQLDLFGGPAQPSPAATLATPSLPPQQQQQQLNFITGATPVPGVQAEFAFQDRSPFVGAAPGQAAFDFQGTAPALGTLDVQNFVPVGRQLSLPGIPAPLEFRRTTPPLDTASDLSAPAPGQGQLPFAAAEARAFAASQREQEMAAEQQRIQRAADRRAQPQVPAGTQLDLFQTTPPVEAARETRRTAQLAASLADTLYNQEEAPAIGQRALPFDEPGGMAPASIADSAIEQSAPALGEVAPASIADPATEINQTITEVPAAPRPEGALGSFVESLRSRLLSAGDDARYAGDNAEILGRLVYTLAEATGGDPAAIAARLELYGGPRGARTLARRSTSEAQVQGAHQRVRGISKIFFGPKPNPQAMTHEFYHFFLWEALTSMQDTSIQNASKTQLESDLRQLAAIVGVAPERALDARAWRETLPGARDGLPATRNAQERVAHQFTRYLREGVAPTPGLRGLFERIATAMRAVFQSLQQLARQGVRIDPAYTRAFNEIFGRQLTPEVEGANALRGPEPAAAEGSITGSVADDRAVGAGPGALATAAPPAGAEPIVGSGPATESAGPGGAGVSPVATARRDGGDTAAAVPTASSGGAELGTGDRGLSVSDEGTDLGQRVSDTEGGGRPVGDLAAPADSGVAPGAELSPALRSGMNDLGWTDADLARWQRDGTFDDEIYDELFLENLDEVNAELNAAAEEESASIDPVAREVESFADEPADSGTAGALAAEAQEFTTDAKALEVTLQTRNEDLGARSLGSAGRVALDGTVQTLADANPSAERTVPLVRRAWTEFQRTATKRTSADKAYAAREFNQVVADAVVDSARGVSVDPFYQSVAGGDIGRGLAAVGRNAKTIGVLVSETDLTPGRPLADGGNLQQDAVAVEGLPPGLGYVAAWLRQNSTFKDGETFLMADRANGEFYAVTPGAKKWTVSPLGAVVGHRYDGGRAMAGLDSHQEVVTTPSGALVVDSLRGTEDESILTNRTAAKEPGFTRPGDALKAFTGDVVYVGEEFDVADYAELDFMAVVPEGAMTENILDILAPHPQGTPVQAAQGNVAAQAMLDAIADPKFADVAYNAGGNPVVDRVITDTMLQHSLDAGNGTSKPTSGDKFMDGAEGSLSAAGRQTLRGPTVSEAFLRQVNVTGQGLDANQPGFFSDHNQFGPAQEIRRSRTLGTTIAQAVETTQAVFNQWLADVEPMVDTEQENHPLRKATMLAFSQTAAATERLQRAILDPIADIARALGRKYGKTAPQIKNELDQWTTARHVLEASPVFRQTALVDRIAAETNARNKQKLEAQLRAYDALQAMTAEQSLALPWNERAKVVGGMTVNEARFFMDSAEKLYDVGDIQQYADAVVEGFATTTEELLEAGIISREEQATWQNYQHFVSLTTDMQSNVASINDVAPFLRGNRFDYTRDGSQVAAEGALAALEKKVSRTAAALGGREMGFQLMAFIDRNRATNREQVVDGLLGQKTISAQEAADLKAGRPTTARARHLFNTAVSRAAGGLIRVPSKSIQRGIRSEHMPRAHYYKLLNETPGVTYLQKKRDSRGNIRNISWKVMFDPRGDRSAAVGSPESLASIQHHAELNQSLTGTYKSSKLTSGMQSTVGRGTRLYGSLLVKFRPYIAPGLAMKDFIGRVINLAGREVQGPDGKPISGWRMAAKMMQMALHPNMFADYTSAFFERPGWQDTYFGKYLREGRESGAFYTILSTLQSAAKPGDYLKSKSLVTTPLRGIDAVLRGNQEYFGAIVPALHYVSMREMGVRPGDAAAKTLELMNFHEKGLATPFLSSLYPFFRPTIQDGAAMLRSLGFGHNAFRRSPLRGKVRAWSTVMGLTWAMTQLIPFLRGVAGDDDETEVNRYDAIPMSQLMWGIPIFTGQGKEDGRYKFAPGFGPGQFSWVSANVFDRVRRGLMEPGDGAMAIAGAFYRGISPADVPPGSFGDNPSAWLLQMFTPPIGRSAVDLAMNRNAFGRAIHQPVGNVPLGTKKYESGYHTTPDIWHQATQHINDTFGVDLFPESLRFVWTETMQGPLSIMTAYLEEDSKYKRPTTIALADKVGAIHLGLGASSYYSAPNNVTSEMFYRYKNQLETKIQKAGAKTTSPDTPRGGKERLVRRNMAEAGFDDAEIEQYVQIMRADIAIDKLDTAFRKAVRPHRFDEDPAETTADLYTDWREAREALMAQAVRNVGTLR